MWGCGLWDGDSRAGPKSAVRGSNTELGQCSGMTPEGVWPTGLGGSDPRYPNKTLLGVRLGRAVPGDQRSHDNVGDEDRENEKQEPVTLRIRLLSARPV